MSTHLGNVIISGNGKQKIITFLCLCSAVEIFPAFDDDDESDLLNAMMFGYYVSIFLFFDTAFLFSRLPSYSVPTPYV